MKHNTWKQCAEWKALVTMAPLAGSIVITLAIVIVGMDAIWEFVRHYYPPTASWVFWIMYGLLAHVALYRFTHTRNINTLASALVPPLTIILTPWLLVVIAGNLEGGLLLSRFEPYFKYCIYVVFVVLIASFRMVLADGKDRQQHRQNKQLN